MFDIISWTLCLQSIISSSNWDKCWQCIVFVIIMWIHQHEFHVQVFLPSETIVLQYFSSKMKKVEKSKLACDQLEDWQSVSEVESSRVSGETPLLTKKSRHNHEDMFWMMVSLCVCVSVSLCVFVRVCFCVSVCLCFCVQQSCVLFTGCKLPRSLAENISISALRQKSTQLPGQPKSKWKSWRIKKTSGKKRLRWIIQRKMRENMERPMREVLRKKNGHLRKSSARIG